MDWVPCVGGWLGHHILYNLKHEEEERKVFVCKAELKIRETQGGWVSKTYPPSPPVFGINHSTKKDSGRTATLRLGFSD